MAQAGDTTMDEAISLIRNAMELIGENDDRPEVRSFFERAEEFLKEMGVDLSDDNEDEDE